MTIDSLIDKYDKRVPYEERSKESDKQRKRKERQRDLKELTQELFEECKGYKRLVLTPYQKATVCFLVRKFGNDFKMLHGKADSKAIILAFIFYVRINDEPKINLKDYKIASEYDFLFSR